MALWLILGAAAWLAFLMMVAGLPGGRGPAPKPSRGRPWGASRSKSGSRAPSLIDSHQGPETG